MPEDDPYFTPDPPRPRRGSTSDAQNRVRDIARRSQIPDDIAEDYLATTKIESGHRLDVRDSPKGAQGFGQVMPDAKGGTTRTVGGRRYNLRNPDENIEAGLRYFAEGGNDPVRRRLYYFGGPRAAQTYDRTGRIPNISDGNMSASQYVKATGANAAQKPQPQTDPYFTPDVEASVTQPSFPRGTTRGRATGRAEMVRPRRPMSGQVADSGLGAPPMAIADLRRRDSEAIQRAQPNIADIRQRDDRIASRVSAQYAKGQPRYNAYQAAPANMNAEIARQTDAEMQQDKIQREIDASRPQVDALKAKLKEFSQGFNAPNPMVSNRGGERIVQSIQSALANSGIQAGNLISLVSKRGEGLTKEMRLAQQALAELEAEDPDKGWQDAAERGLPAAAIELAKMYMVSRGAGRATLPTLGALSEADQGPEAAAKGAVIGELYHRGFGAMSKLPKPVQFVGGTAIPTGVAVAEGADPKRALLENTAFGAMALAGGKPRGRQLRPAPEAPTAREAAPTLTPSELQKRTELRVRGEGREATTEIPARFEGRSADGRTANVESENAPIVQGVRTDTQVASGANDPSVLRQARESVPLIPEGVNRETIPQQQENAPTVRAMDSQGQTQPQPNAVPSRSGRVLPRDVSRLEQEGINREVQTEPQPIVEARVEGEEPRVAGAESVPGAGKGVSGTGIQLQQAQAVEAPSPRTRSEQAAAQNRRERNTKYGAKGDFAKGFKESESQQVNPGQGEGPRVDRLKAQGYIPVVRRQSERGAIQDKSESVFFSPREPTESGLGEKDYGNALVHRVIDKNAKVYKGNSSLEFAEERGLLSKPDPIVKKELGVDTLQEAIDKGLYPDGANPLDDGFPWYRALQQIAARELKKEGYQGAFWRGEDALSPNQYQVWDRSVLKRAGDVLSTKPTPPPAQPETVGTAAKPVATETPTTATLDGKTYTNRNGEWYRDSDGRKVRGEVVNRINASIETPAQPLKPENTTLPAELIPPPPSTASATPPATQGGATAPSPARSTDIQSARKKVADDWRRNAEVIRREDLYADHVEESTKDAQLAKALKFANEVERGERDGNFTIAQRLHHEMTGESFPFLPPTKSTTPATQPAIKPQTRQEGATARVSTPSPALKGEVKPPPSTTSAKKAQMGGDREAMDLPELPAAQRKSWRESLAEAKPESANRLADEVLANPRGLNDSETASVVVRAQQVKSEHAQRMAEIAKSTDAEAITKLRGETQALEAEFDKLTQATKASGTEKGRTLAAQKLTINQDFDLVSVKARLKAAKGRPLTEKEDVRVEQMVKERDQAIKERDAALEKARVNQIQKQIDRVQRQRIRADTKEALDAEAATIKQNIAAEFMRLKAQSAQNTNLSQQGLGLLDPEGVITRNLVKYARNRVRANVGLKAEALLDDATALIQEFNKGITRQQVADLLSGYKMSVSEPRAEDVRRLAEIRAEIKKMRAQEDVAAGIRTKRMQGPRRSDIRKLPMQGPSRRLFSRNEARLKHLEKQEVELARRLEQRDFSKPEKAEPLPYTREVAARQRQVEEIERLFAKEEYKATRSTGGKITDELAKAANVPKTIKSIGDISAVFRQGGYLAITHPVEGGIKPFREMVRSFTDAGGRNVSRMIEADPAYKVLKRAGAEFTGIEKDNPQLSLREEGLLGKEYLDYIPVAKQIKDFSERTFVNFLDAQRLFVGKQMLDGLANPGIIARTLGAKQGLSRSELVKDQQRIARLLNSATGRGNLSAKGNQITPALNILMFSPRLLKSRIELLNNMFNPVAIYNMPRNARAQIVADNVKFLAATAAVLTLAKAAGAEVSFDPDDGDFLKIRVGDTSYDTLTGLQQPFRYLYNMQRAGRAAITGDETYAGRDMWTQTMGTRTRGGFLESKVAPTISAGIETMRGTDFLGRKRSAATRAIDIVKPLILKDFIEAAKQEGLIGIVKATPAIAGIGVTSYPQPPEKATTHAEKLARKIIREGMRDKAQTEEEIEQSRGVADLRARSRRGEDVSVEASKLPDRQQKAVIEAKGRTRLQEDFRRLSLDPDNPPNAFTVWSVATEAERAELKPVLADMADRVSNLDPSKREPAKAQLRAIGIVPGERRQRQQQQQRQQRPQFQ